MSEEPRDKLYDAARVFRHDGARSMFVLQPIPALQPVRSGTTPRREQMGASAAAVGSAHSNREDHPRSR